MRTLGHPYRMHFEDLEVPLRLGHSEAKNICMNLTTRTWEYLYRMAFRIYEHRVGTGFKDSWDLRSTRL